MNRKWIAAGLVALSLTSVAAPAFAQGIVIGPDGVRVIDPRDRDRDRDRDRGDMRRDDMRREDPRRGGISERQAVRIARGEGLRDLDDVRQMRRVYRIEGADRRGRDITVDVDRFSGDVISVR